MLNCFDLTGKTALTGGSQGLGRAFARAFAKSGCNISLIARTEEKLTYAQHEIETLGVRCSYHVADILDVSGIQEAVDATEKEFGSINFLINNAAANAQHVPLEDIAISDFQHVVETNITGTMIVTQITVRKMIKNKNGAIVNLCSIAGQVFHGYHYPGAYEATKDGLKALTRSMAYNWAPYGIRVNGISPGYFLSDANLTACKRNPSVHDALASQVPLARWGEPDEIGPVAVFLCSDAAKYMTGTIVTVDGGRTFR